MHTAAELDGTLGYEGEVPVVAGTAGMVTRLPDEGKRDPAQRHPVRARRQDRPRLFYGARRCGARSGLASPMARTSASSS